MNVERLIDQFFGKYYLFTVTIINGVFALMALMLGILIWTGR